MGVPLVRSHTFHIGAHNKKASTGKIKKSEAREVISNPSSDGSYVPMATWRIILCAIAMCGIQVCYAAQINMGTAELLLLGMSERAVSLAWLAGPLSGLIVQPLVGYASDNCTSRFGRRRPFLLAGTLFTAASLLLFCNAQQIAKLLVPPVASAKVALAIAVCAFFLLDFSIQAIQAPLRALVTDVVPQPQRATANSYVAVFTGLGNFLGGVLAALRLSVIFPFFANDVQALFTSAAVILLLTVFACVLATPEIPLTISPFSPVSETNYDGSPRSAVNDASPGNDVTNSLLRESNDGSDDTLSRGKIWKALAGVPRPFWQVFAVQLFTWCGFFTLFVYVNTWVGRNVYLGDGTAPAGSAERETFESGIRLGGKGNALTALLTLGYALGLPSLLEKYGILKTYAFSQLVEAICLMLAPLIRGTPGQKRPSAFLRLAALIDIGMFGVVWATTMGVPWTIIGNALESNEKYASQMGLYTTLFNASQSFPQLIVAFAAPIILTRFDDDPSMVMFLGGICALIGAVLVYMLRVDLYDSNTNNEDLLNEHGIIDERMVEEGMSSRGRSLDSMMESNDMSIDEDRWWS